MLTGTDQEHMFDQMMQRIGERWGEKEDVCRALDWAFGYQRGYQDAVGDDERPFLITASRKELEPPEEAPPPSFRLQLLKEKLQEFIVADSPLESWSNFHRYRGQELSAACLLAVVVSFFNHCNRDQQDDYVNAEDIVKRSPKKTSAPAASNGA